MCYRASLVIGTDPKMPTPKRQPNAAQSRDVHSFPTLHSYSPTSLPSTLLQSKCYHQSLPAPLTKPLLTLLRLGTRLHLPCISSTPPPSIKPIKEKAKFTYPLLLAIPVRPTRRTSANPLLPPSARKMWFKYVVPTYWKKSLHMARSPPLRFRQRMLLSAASWHGSKYSLYALLFCTSSVSEYARAWTV